jgi:hypothetical protein
VLIAFIQPPHEQFVIPELPASSALLMWVRLERGWMRSHQFPLPSMNPLHVPPPIM